MMKISKELFMQLEDCENAEAIVKLLAANNITVTQEQAEQILASFERDLTEEELERVAGGGNNQKPSIPGMCH